MYRLAKLANYKLILAVAFVALFGLVIMPSTTYGAVCDPECQDDTQECVVNDAGEAVCVEKVATDFGVAEYGTALDLGDKSLDTAVVDIINLLLGFLGLIAVVVILIGGFKWMTAGGNDEKVGEARKWIFSGIIGLAIILSAWAISKFVIEQLAIATGSGLQGGQ